MSPCIISPLMPEKGGYRRKKYKGKKVPHHRLALALHLQVEPDTLMGIVMHACDNRGCINPEHLSLGTHQDNSSDMVSKGRSSKKLSLQEVQYVRDNFVPRQYGCVPALALKFGVTRNQIYRIIREEQRIQLC